VGDDGFGSYDFVEDAVGVELREGLAQVTFGVVLVVAELGEVGVAVGEPGPV
jgi:hypothetical protein